MEQIIASSLVFAITLLSSMIIIFHAGNSRRKIARTLSLVFAAILLPIATLVYAQTLLRVEIIIVPSIQETFPNHQLIKKPIAA